MPEGTREMLLVQSKLRDEIRKREVRVSDDFINALNNEIYALIDKAVARCNGNGRKTLGKFDI